MVSQGLKTWVGEEYPADKRWEHPNIFRFVGSNPTPSKNMEGFL